MTARRTVSRDRWKPRESGEARPSPRPAAAPRPAALPPPPPAAAAGSVSRRCALGGGTGRGGEEARGRGREEEEGGGRSALRTERCLSAIAAEEAGEGSAAAGARAPRRRLVFRRSLLPPAARPALRAAPGAAARSEDRRRPPPPGPGPAAPRASSAPLPRGAPPPPAPKMSNLSKGTGSRKDTKMRIRAFPVSTGSAGPRPPAPGSGLCRPRGLTPCQPGGGPGRAWPAAGLRGAGGCQRAGRRREPGTALRVRRRWVVGNGAPRAPAGCSEAPRCGESTRGGGAGGGRRLFVIKEKASGKEWKVTRLRPRRWLAPEGGWYSFVSSGEFPRREFI